VLLPRFAPERFLALVERHRITHVQMVPTMFIRLLKLPEPVRSRYDVSSLEHVVHAAAPCPVEVKRAMIEWWGPVIHEYYGSTESGAVTFCNSEEYLSHPGTVGRPMANCTVRILDGQGRALPQGEVGEIYARDPTLPDFTYHGLDAKRREMERDGLITSGDMGYLDAEGYLYLCDRKIDMVISGGVNIYPAEVEAVLLRHSQVRDCAVFGIPDEEFGETLAAAVQPNGAQAPQASELQAYLGEHLAAFKVPRLIEVRADLPREDSGKIFKRKLRAPYWEKAGRAI
jgi:long-chain acyl-CoA synthetase